MTIKLGTLSADVVANTYGFDRNLNRSHRNLALVGQKMSKSVKSFEQTVQSSFSNAARSVAAIQGPLGPIAGRLSSISSTVGATGIALGGFALAVAGAGFALKKAADEGEKFERSALRIEALLKTTNSASGQTAEGIRQFSRELAKSTLQSVDGVEQATAVLLSFRSISGETFKTALKAATDLSEVYGQDLKSSIVQLGKALNDPIKNLSALSRTGTTFTKSQEDTIKNLAETNRLGEAQALILEEINRQVGGAGSGAAQGLSGAYDTLAQSVSEFWQALDDKTGSGDKFAEIARSIAESLDTINQSLSPELFKPLGQQVVEATNRLIQLEDAYEEVKKAAKVEGFGTGLQLQELEQQIDAQKRLIEALQDKGKAQVDEQKQAERLAEINSALASEDERWSKIDEERAEALKAKQKADEKALATRQAVINSLQGELNALTVQTTALQDANVTLEMAAQAYDIRNQQIRAGVDAMSAEGQKIAELIKLRDQELSKIEQRNRSDSQITADFDAAQASAQEYAKDLEAFSDIQVSLSQSDLQKLQADLEKLNTALKEGAISPEDYKVASDRINNQITNIKYNTESMGDAFKDSFKDFITGAGSASDMAKSLAGKLLEIAAIDPFVNIVGGAVSSGLGTAFGGLFGGFFAEGGVPPMGKVSVVGENGPELFVPNTTGTIIPNDQIGAGGGGTTIYADMRGASMEAVQRLEQFAQKINASIEPRAVSAVANQRSRQPNLFGGA